MPRKLALDLHQPHLLTVQIGSDLRAPMLRKTAEFLWDVATICDYASSKIGGFLVGCRRQVLSQL